MTDEGFPCPDCDFVAKSSLGLASHSKKHKVRAPKESEAARETTPPPAGTLFEEAEAPEAEGKRPRFRLLGGKKEESTKERKPRERKPTEYAGRRSSLSELGTGIWKGLAWSAAQGGYVAAGRAFSLQADAAGPAFDRLVKGTFLDGILQPIARLGANGKDFAALGALPPSAEAYARNPNEVTASAFKAALIGALPQIAKAHKDTVKRYQRLEADLAGMAEMFGKAPGERVSLDEVAMWIVTGSTAPQPETGSDSEVVDAEFVSVA